MSNVIINRYGINRFLSKIYLNRIDSTSNNEEYKHTVEIVQGDSYNGNGYCTMKIYTKGELKELSCGTWKISPIVNMPYCWAGYSDKIEVMDKNGESYIINITPDSTSIFKKGNDFTLDVKAVCEEIYSLDKWYNVLHLRLEDIMKDIENDMKYNLPIEEKIKLAKETCSLHNTDTQFQKIIDQYILRIINIEKSLHD